MQSINNVKKILLQLSKYQINCSLYNIPLLKVQEQIMENVPSKYWVIFFRKAMYSISNLLANSLNINALITGLILDTWYVLSVYKRRNRSSV